MGPSIITFAGYVIFLLDFANSASNRRCFPTYTYTYPYDGRSSLCFTQPDPPVALSWSDAQQWCSNIGATLPKNLPHSDIYFNNYHTLYRNALGYFGLDSNTIWLGANSTFDLNDWYWANGTSFKGDIDHGNDTQKTHAYVIRNGTDIKIVAANPKTETAGVICQPIDMENDELACANRWNSYWANGKCYTKYKGQFSTWNSYVVHCNGVRNLASLGNFNEISRWIDERRKFWIGLSCTWWNWQDIVSGRSYRVSDTRFDANFPNNTSPECLASYEDFYGNVQWMNRNCSTELQFICQEHVNLTIKTSPTPPTRTTATHSDSAATTARQSTATSFDTLSNELSTTYNNMTTVSRTSQAAGNPSMTVKFSRNTLGPIDSYEDIYSKYGLDDLLIFGLCGALFLVVFVWLAVLTARICRINGYSSKTLPKQHIEHLQLTCSNPYEISPFDNTHALKEEGHSFAVGDAEKSCEQLSM